MKKVKYLYSGRILTPSFKVLQRFFLNGDFEKPVYFMGIKNVYIGKTYFGSRDKMPKRPESAMSGAFYVVSEKSLDEWNAQDFAAAEFLKQRAENKKAKDEMKKLSSSKKVRELKKQIQELTKGFNLFQVRYFVESLTRK